MKKCIITVYYLIDNFYKIYQEWERNRLIPVVIKGTEMGSCP
ncbi:putative transposase [Orientia tsutsugamushi str. Gilliam]|uniref:Putative transposase n=1 Tax=Orientia tsutsugamushi str. Gilliam TaxID=1359184 RepID=A0A0F3MDS8_ORITS|nr:putative transposase [Orientia tsutsugamushi str. Gilliam]